ncbi:hypothetical protein [Paenibacillus sp. P46E]|uniref:hypothetical protein n=1 Tax=Paenibacillus sp. P46E TaxID=1349436 RepID=UPI00093F8A45|nr:hypothetical protein [Paenibacillus sp. P46E]OKP99644.1 hypothetical protein A3849_03835 [Paenibacillus sp. P46E]
MFKKIIPLVMLLALFFTAAPQLVSTSYGAGADSDFSNTIAPSGIISVDSLVSPAALADPASAKAREAEAATAAARGTYPNGLSIEGGDVLITNNTSSAGLTGHAGIVTDATGNIASIAGYGYHPAMQSLATWFGNNPNTIVIRNSNTSLAHSAGSWAASYVSLHSSASYGLVNNLLNLNEVYCSKIPWLAYYSFGLNVGGKYTVGYDITLPYEWKDYGQFNQFGFSKVATFGNW